VDASTLLRRTTAGDAELAVPANGLSLTQRRVLTLLDTPIRLRDLAAGQALGDERLARELSRLVRLGLVEATAEADANADAAIGAVPVRLGAPRFARKAPVVAMAAVAGALVWWGWQSTAPSAPSAQVPQAPRASSVAQARPGSDTDAEPATIATRVLRNEPTDRVRDAPKEARAPSAAKTAPAGHADTGSASDSHEPPSMPESPDNVPVTIAAASAPAPEAGNVRVESDSRESSKQAAGIAPPSSPPPAEPVPGTAPVQLAAATPPAQATRAPAPAKLMPVSRETPEFPREAIARGVDRGIVKARLTVDAQGRVGKVDILEATPQRVFDRAVRDALSRWQFEPGAAERTTTVDLTFKRD